MIFPVATVLSALSLHTLGVPLAKDDPSGSASPDASESPAGSGGASADPSGSGDPSSTVDPSPSHSLPGLDPIVDSAPMPIRPWLSFGIPVVAAIVVTWVVWFVLSRILRRRPRVREQLRRLQIPVFLFLLSVGLILGTPGVISDPEWSNVVAVVLKVAAVGAATWLIVTALSVVEVSIIEHYREEGDPRQVAKLRTQVTLLRRVVTAVVLVLGIGAVLLMIPTVRAMGATVLASAGLISVVAGLAVQGVLTNVFAGLQLAFSDAVRVQDIVVVEGQRGNIKEITLTYVVVVLTDGRKMILPSTYFVSTPFENWSRGSEEIEGYVTLDLSWDAPVPALRKHVAQLLDASDLWDGRYSETSVTDAEGGNMELTVVVTARNPSDLWNLKNYVRERLVQEVIEKYPDSLPRVTPSIQA